MSNSTQLVVLPGARKVGIGPLPSFVKPVSADPDPDLKRAIKAVLTAKKVAVVVGAGISTAANIPDFRSSTGLFASLKARFPNARLTSGRDLFDVNAWKDPDTLSLHLGMLAELHKMCGAAQPTAFHQFLKRLDDDGKLSRVYTQNIDGLEEKAGLSYGIPGFDDICPSSSSSASRSRPSDAPATPQKRNLKRKRDEALPSNLPPTPRSTPPPPASAAEMDKAKANINSADHECAKSEASCSQSELSEPCSSQLSSVSTVCPPPSSPSKTARSRALTRSASAAEATAFAATAAQPRPTRPKPVDPFPRVIPLHGTLKNLSCLTCKHSVLMSDYIGPLTEGEMVLCPQCQSFDDARAVLGYRTRGVGLLKSGVVLYGEEHIAGDQVGAVTSRDLMRGRRPDLLIVAGTSLKVPGTKRLVKELSKVIKPLSKPPSDSDECEDEEESSSAAGRKPAPIHTIFLNNEFPSPCGLWKDTFDVWVKGNVDQFIQLVDEERKSQEELKLKKAQEKIERERRKEERLKKASLASVPPASAGCSDAPPLAATLPETPKRRSSQAAPKAPKLTLKAPHLAIPKTQSTAKPAAGKAKTKNSVAGFFKTGKAAVGVEQASKGGAGSKAAAKGKSTSLKAAKVAAAATQATGGTVKKVAKA